MDFMLWSVRAMHLFSVILWLGGLLYQAVIVLPLLVSGQSDQTQMILNQLKGFLPFNWMALMTILITGAGLMLFSPRFVFLSYDSWWSMALGIKQSIFLLIALLSLGYSRILIHLIGHDRPGVTAEMGARLTGRLQRVNRASILLGIGAVLLAASMN